ALSATDPALSATDPAPSAAGPAARAGGPAARATGLSVALGDTPLLADATLTLTPGRVTAITGPSGAGKTTLLRKRAPAARAATRVTGRARVQARRRL
ncbi:ATP-binding cassette domain-containing protein, partial [Kitasatospora sp. NPDC056783]|uniref:ATP-binding cassette domain-containing protein n=1 Tax=Kitasatospora sp. NPDC056783 TaxID=3345943 RepID=UPI0036909F16